MLFKKKLWRGAAYTSSLLLVLSIVVGQTMESYSDYVDSAFGTHSSEVVTDEGKTYDKFTPDDKYVTKDANGNITGGNSKALIQDAITLGAKAGAEGCVLLKNNNTLPLKEKSAVTLLGMRSEIPLVGAGMGVMAQGAMITLQDGLSATKTNFKDADHIATYFNRSSYGSTPKPSATITDGYQTFDDFDIDGAGFTVNPDMGPIYKKYNESLDEQHRLTNNDSIPNPASQQYTTGEPSLEEIAAINPNYKANFATYGDAAIVVIGRPSNESYDFWKGDMDDAEATEPLQLSKNEKAAIQLATDNFKNVVVLINSAAPMDIQSLKDNDKIGAIMYVGQPGTYGFLGVAQVLAGKVSPSGHLADTFASNQLSAPSMVNFGDYTFSNADSMNRKSTIGGTNTSKKYVIEAEGIYTGYKYYETRYDDVVEGKGNASAAVGITAGTASWDYDKEVTYPFGYGLTYSNFSQVLVSAPEVTHSAHEWTLDFQVKVTNNGEAKGKDVVQIYGQAPYTDGGIEKSAIQLLAFGKTSELAPKASETLTISVDLQNLASYDMSHVNSDGTKGTYVLDKGNHYFAIGNGAHEALNNILTERGFNANGDKNKVYTYSIDSYDDTTFSVSKNNTSISNQLSYSDWNFYGPKTTVTYLSRHDWKGTWPIEYKDMEASESLVQDLNGVGANYYQYKENSDVDVKWGVNSNANLANMFQAEWDDSRWDALLDQVTLSEAIQMIMYGGPNLAGAASVGWAQDLYLTENSGSGVTLALSATKDPSAPWSIKEGDNNAAWKGGVFPNAPTTACSFNADMWKEIGDFVGTEGLFTGITFLWGPGLNTHRSSYNGRTGEYYSEDGVLAGNVAMEYAYGALQQGMIASPKHFAFNDQETNRAGVAPFMTEQRARETELRAYQIAIESTKYDKLTGKDCGMRGLMTSFSKIGGVEVTCSYGLMTNILQKEWGFHGYAVTDIYDDTDLFVPVAASGVTCFDLRGQNSNGGNGITSSMFGSQAQGYTHSLETYQKDAVLQSRMKLAVKNLVWVTAQSSMMNRFNANSHTVKINTPWRVTYTVCEVVFGVLAGLSAILFVVSVFKNKEAK